VCAGNNSRMGRTSNNTKLIRTENIKTRNSAPLPTGLLFLLFVGPSRVVSTCLQKLEHGGSVKTASETVPRAMRLPFPKGTGKVSFGGLPAPPNPQSLEASHDRAKCPRLFSSVQSLLLLSLSPLRQLLLPLLQLLPV